MSSGASRHQRAIEQWRSAMAEFEDALAALPGTSDDLLARARELRSEAETTDVYGFRNAALGLAERYEAAALTRNAAA